MDTGLKMYYNTWLVGILLTNDECDGNNGSFESFEAFEAEPTDEVMRVPDR